MSKKKKEEPKFEDLSIRQQIKSLEKDRKPWIKYLKKLKKFQKEEAYWLNWLIEYKLPYLRQQHAAYKRALRQVAKSFPDTMGDTMGRICRCEHEIEAYTEHINRLIHQAHNQPDTTPCERRGSETRQSR